MHTIIFNDISYQLPTSWQEVKPKHIYTIAKLLIGKVDAAAQLDILRIVLDFSKSDWKKTIAFYFDKSLATELLTQNSEAIFEITQIISWLWSSPMTQKPFEYIKVYKDLKPTAQHWQLPEPDLKAVSWAELCDACFHYEVFTKQLIEGNKHLHLLIATMCRPANSIATRKRPDWDGDKRLPYNQFITEDAAELLVTHNEEEKTILLVYLAGCISTVFSHYKISDGHTEDKSTEEYPGQAIEKNTLAIAEKGIFGNYDAVRAKNCHNVLIYLEENKKDIEAQRQETERLNAQYNHG